MTEPIKSEIRKSFLLNKYVIITPGRAKRPRDIKETTIIKRTNECPFCPDKIIKKNVLDQILNNQKKWEILSIKNIFPAVSYNNNKAYGTQEVIIETRHHTKELADMSISHIANLFFMYAKRTAAISKNKRIDYILCLKNQGSKAGASIVHAHSQIFATELLPPDMRQELQAAKKYKEIKKTCPYCDLIKKEISGERKIFEDENIATFTPYASEYHYEAWIFTKRHLDNITKLNKQELRSLAQAYKLILIKLQKLDLSFNVFLHQVISDYDQHFYLKIQPRDSIWAGVELGSGLIINSISPELAARYYRS